VSKDDGNPFQRHSTLLAFSSAAVVVCLFGAATHWKIEFAMYYVIAGLAALWFFSRVFYGFGSARRLDKEPVAKGSMGMGGAGGLRIDWDGREINELQRAYRQAELGDPSALERLAEEEDA
jgi:uncharacterized membrane protein YuzA (DUF378 family)